MAASLTAATVASILLCLANSARAALLLSRPAGDCLSPAVSTLNYNFYPDSYQLKSIQSAAYSSGLETTVDFAEDFSVTYKGTYKVVKNKRANETYVLYQCGTPNPLQTANTESNLPANTKVFEIPLVSVSVTDSTAAGFLVELGLLDRVAFSSAYSYNSCLQAINGCSGDAASADQPTDYDISTENDAEYQQTVAAWKNASTVQDPQVDAIFSSTPNKNPKSIAVSAFADPGVLNRAEWVKFVAAFFNKEVEAEKLFTKISEDYQSLNASVASTVSGKTRPVVAWISKSGDTITVAYANYKKQYIEDAGGVLPAVDDLLAAGATLNKGLYSTVDYIFNASVPAQKQGFISILNQVNIIFDDSYGFGSGNQKDVAGWKQLYGISDAEADTIPAVSQGNVYTFNNRLSAVNAAGDVGSDWFESAVARPDLVLVDFVRVITPSAIQDNAPLTWLRKLPATRAALTANTASSCESLKDCKRAEPARICPNAYRDCNTGELKTVEDPTQRCEVQTTCPTAQSGALQNSAGTVFAGRQILLAVLVVALLNFLLCRC